MIPYGHQSIDDDDIEQVIQVLKSDWITTGPKIEEFEKALCAYIGCRYAIAVNSGTSALDIAVQALNLPPGSEIITTPFTFVATSNAILYNGLKVVFADIDEETRNIDPEDIRRKVNKNTRALIYVDYAGQPCYIDELKKIAIENSLYLIEDACHALGAEYKGVKVGNFADMTILSFHPVKHITTGEGGAVLTNSDELFERLKMLRNHGIDKSAFERFGPSAGWAYNMKLLGRNYRLTDIQAALGISQLKKIDTFIAIRERIVKEYNDSLKCIDEIKIPTVKPYMKSAWHLYTILLNGLDRDELFRRMRANGIGVNVHYIPIYRFTFYKNNFNFAPEDFPVTERVFKNILTIPVWQGLKENEVSEIIEDIKSTISNIISDT